MQKEHRVIIQRNFSSLVEQTDLDMMVAALFEKGVFSEAMIERYKDTNKDARTRKRMLYMDIMRRGPDAFRNLIEALLENGYWDLVRVLDPHELKRAPPRMNQNTMDESSFLSLSGTRKKKATGKENGKELKRPADPPKIDTMPVQRDRKIPHFNVIKSTKFVEEGQTADIKLYRTRGRNRGVLFLFTYMEYENNIERYRYGADVDADNLKYLFTELGFKVLVYQNLTLPQTKDTLSKLKEVMSGECPETVFIMFSSHGYERRGSGDNDIRCSDGSLIGLYEIIEYFNNDRFPALRNIPKVFIFQNCRGSNEGYTSSSPRGPEHLRNPDSHRGAHYDGSRGDSGGAAPRRPLPRPPGDVTDATGDNKDRIYSDILIAHSTVPGCVSNRDTEYGSWYVRSICEVFAKHAHNKHVSDLFTLVDDDMRVKYNEQTSSIDRWGFNKHLYLHPGLYEDEVKDK